MIICVVWHTYLLVHLWPPIEILFVLFRSLSFVFHLLVHVAVVAVVTVTVSGVVAGGGGVTAGESGSELLLVVHGDVDGVVTTMPSGILCCKIGNWLYAERILVRVTYCSQLQISTNAAACWGTEFKSNTHLSRNRVLEAIHHGFSSSVYLLLHFEHGSFPSLTYLSFEWIYVCRQIIGELQFWRSTVFSPNSPASAVQWCTRAWNNRKETFSFQLVFVSTNWAQ